MRRAFAVMLASMVEHLGDSRQKEGLLRVVRDSGTLDKDEVLVYWGLTSSGSCNEIFAKNIMMQILQEKETDETKVFFSILRRITKHGSQKNLSEEAKSFLDNLLEKEIPLALVDCVKEKFKTI